MNTFHILYLPLRSIHTDLEVVIAAVNFTEDASAVAAVAVVALPTGVHEPLEPYDHLSFSRSKLKTQESVLFENQRPLDNRCIGGGGGSSSEQVYIQNSSRRVHMWLRLVGIGHMGTPCNEQTERLKDRHY